MGAGAGTGRIEAREVPRPFDTPRAGGYPRRRLPQEDVPTVQPNPFAGVRWIWMNGEMVEFEKATIHVLSHALHYGSGMF